MHTMRFFLAITISVLMAGTKGFAQQEAGHYEPTRQWTYEFMVSGLTSKQDAEKLEAAMTRMVGIYSCKTDLSTKKVIVSCIPGGDYMGLQIIVQSVGFVADDSYLSLKEEEIAPKSKKED